MDYDPASAPRLRGLLLGCALAVAAVSRMQAQSPLPTWLTDLSFAAREGYDDNVLIVSGLGMPEASSWTTALSLKVGTEFAGLLPKGGPFQSLSVTYQPERDWYHQAPSEDYTAHRLAALVKGKSGPLTFSLDESFLYVDGSKIGVTYAANQLSGAAASQFDKYRNFYSQAVPRERRNQVQDRYGAQVRYDTASTFVRLVSNLIYYNLNTELFNTSAAPYKGYQDWPDRWDLNLGADWGFKLAPGWALFAGYRDGYQHQDQFSLGINSDQHFSSNRYQRVLLGVEGKLAPWLAVKLAAGPDLRDYNPMTPITSLRTTRMYEEGSVVATVSASQSLSIAYKKWMFVSSTGVAPYTDTNLSAIYHWTVSKSLGVDVGAKYQEANFGMGDDYAGSAPSLRDDTDYQASFGVSYVLRPGTSLSLNYAYDKGLNGLAGLAATYYPAYRNFEHAVISAGVQTKF